MQKARVARFRTLAYRHVRKALVTGALIAVPLVVTYLVFKWLFQTLDGILQPAITYVFGRSLPGVGLIALVVLVYAVGLVAANVVGRRLVRHAESVLSRTPVVRYVYKATRELLDAARDSRRTEFNRVVLVDFPRAGMQSIGFITGRSVEVGGVPRFPVFVPTAPNPMSGFVMLVAACDIMDTELTVEEAFRMIVSGGLVAPEKIIRPQDSS